MADYQSIHSGPTIDERVTLAATNQADIAALKTRMSSAETAISQKADASTVSSELAGKADTSTMNAALATKQNNLVSGTNIKTVNGESILGSGNIVAGDPNAVKYVAQSLTEAQKTQARTNIGAASSGDIQTLSGYVVVASINDLPSVGQPNLGYLVGENIYVYVGTGGDTLGGKYKNGGAFRGPAGVGFESIASQEDGTIVITLSNGDTVTIDLNHNHPAYYSKVLGGAQPVGGFEPDVVYSLGTLSGTITFSLASPVTGNVNHYFWMFSTGSTAPTITWPTGITWADGSAPTVAASKHYEVSILGGIAYYSEV